MTNDEAKFILSAYRPSGRDATDPYFADALEQARRDPDLSQWFDRERALDRLVTSKLSEVKAPSRLKSELLMGAQSPSRRAPQLRWLKWGVALAASVVVFAGVFWNENRPAPVASAALVAKAVGMLDHGPSLGMMGPDLDQLKAWLSARKSPVPGKLPDSFARLQGMGCQEFEISGNKVSLICFQQNGKPVHLFVMNIEALTPEARHADPRFAKEGAWAVAQWSDGTHAFLMATEGPIETLQRLL